jgi:hypothetical protein
MSLLRISLIVAVVAGLGAGVVSYLDISDKIPALAQQRDKEHNAKVAEIAAHGKTKTELKKTQSDLAQTKQELADTQNERDKAVKIAEDKTKIADQLTVKLAATTRERDDAQAFLQRYKMTELTPEQILTLNKQIKAARAEVEVVNTEKLVLLHTIGRLSNELKKYVEPEQFVKLRADLHGKILVVDPKWDFVVLNVGEDQGVLTDGELLVSRSGTLVGKVKVRSVQKDRCIANLVPGWKLGEMIEGDEVSPAHPAS